MLILQRKKGESLSINNNITLTVIDAGTDWVKLAVDAPKEIPILRSELKEAADENKKAAKAAPKEILEKLINTK